MTGRVLVLPLGAAVLLGLGVYLFIEVRAAPAPPQLAAAGRSARAPHAPVEPIADQPPALPVPPAPPRSSDRPAAAPPAGGPAVDPVALGSAAEIIAANDAKLDSIMAEANKAYDRGDLEEAKTVAGRVLLHQPSNARMLRILVSASCIDGDATAAQAAFMQLPASDQEQMRVRCSRYGIALSDKPPEGH